MMQCARHATPIVRLAGVVLVCLLLGCKAEEPAAQAPRQVQAETALVQVRRVVLCRSFPAQVESQRSVTLSSKLSGTVVEVFAREGDQLRPGDPILRIDDRDLQGRRAALEASRAQASLERQAQEARTARARTTLERLSRLLAQKVVSQDDYDKAQADALAQTREQEAIAARERNVAAQLDELKALEAYTRVTALSGGVLIRRFVDQGAFVSAGQPLALVDDAAGGFDLTAQVDESLLSGLRVGQPVVAGVPGLGGGPFVTRITALLGRVDPTSRTFKLKAALPLPGPAPQTGPGAHAPETGPGANAKLAGPGAQTPQAGMFGRVYLPVGTGEKVLVPRACLLVRGDLPCVFVADGAGVLRLRVIKIGGTFLAAEIDGQTYLTDSQAFDDEGGPRFVEALSGLSGAERVVCSRDGSLREGDRLAGGRP